VFDDIEFSPAGTEIAMAGGNAAATQVSIYAFTPGVGFGAKYSDPGTAPSMNPKSVAWSPDGTVVLMSGGSTAANAVNAYAFTTGVGWGAKFSNPGVAPPTLTNANGATFAPNQQAVFITYQGSAATKAISGWPWSGAGFGVKYTDPTSLFNNSRGSLTVGVSPNTDAVVIGYMNGSGNNWVSAWAFDAVTGFGTSLAVPTDLAAITPSEVNSAVFVPSGTEILLAIRKASSAEELRLYTWTAGVGFSASAVITTPQMQHPTQIKVRALTGGPSGSQYIVVGACQSQTQAESPFTLSLAGLAGIPLGVTLPPPTQTTVTPNNGSISGGDTVIIGGTNFVATPTVTFDGLPATSVVWLSSTSISCVTPAHHSGYVNVVVTNPDGQVCTLTLVYLYNPNLDSSPPFQTVGQWSVHRVDVQIRREGPS